MRKAHREAAKALYEERNKHLQNGDSGDEELYVDLHGTCPCLTLPSLLPHESPPNNLPGLHPEEAVSYLETILLTHSHSSSAANAVNPHNSSRNVIYAITGTGHHSKNGKDKVGKGVRGWLNDGGWSFREFSVPGERGGYVGGVLGIDVSGRRGPGVVAGLGSGEEGLAGMGANTSGGVVIGEGKVRVLKREEAVGS